jgi:hypothetical protein
MRGTRIKHNTSGSVGLTKWVVALPTFSNEAQFWHLACRHCCTDINRVYQVSVLHVRELCPVYLHIVQRAKAWLLSLKADISFEYSVERGLNRETPNGCSVWLE